MTEKNLSPMWWGAAVVMGGCIAILAAFGLSALATPPDFAERSATLERQTRQIEALASGAGRTPSFSAGAVCEGFGASSQIKLRQVIEAAAIPENLVGARIRLSPPTLQSRQPTSSRSGMPWCLDSRTTCTRTGSAR